MTAQPETHSEHSASGGGGGPATGGGSAADGELLLAALLDGMDAALCAFDATGVVTHWNREAERILGWTSEEAVGRRGLGGWAALEADAPDVEARLFGAMDTPGRQVHEFALMTKDGRRVLVRTQSSGVTGEDGSSTGLYCAFSEVHAQIDLERSIALSEALLEDASWGVVLVDADLRPAVVNVHAARALGVSRAALLGRPLGELLDQGLEELEGAFQHVLAQGAPPAPAEIWVTLRSAGPGDGRSGDGRTGEARTGGGARTGEGRAAPGDGGARRCWRSGFVRLSSPLAEEPVPLGVAWLFQDITQAKRAEREASRARFRDTQLHRAARAAAECEDPMEAAALHLDFALAGFADHALLDLEAAVMGGYAAPVPGQATAGGPGGGPSTSELMAPTRLVRAASSPVSAPGPWPPVEPGLRSGIPVGYAAGHPAIQAYERGGSVRTSVGGVSAAAGEGVVAGWATARKWPDDTVHGLCAVLRSRGRTLGVATFLRGAGRRGFDRSDAAYAEDIAIRIATAVDLARSLR